MRAALAGSEQFSIEYFEKPPGHSSPTHSHDDEQVCLLSAGEVTAVTEDRSFEGASPADRSVRPRWGHDGHPRAVVADVALATVGRSRAHRLVAAQVGFFC